MEELRNMIQPDYAPEWSGQSRDQQPVIGPGDAAGDRARSVSAKAIRDEPLASKQLPRFLVASVREINSANQIIHCESSLIGSGASTSALCAGSRQFPSTSN